MERLCENVENILGGTTPVCAREGSFVVQSLWPERRRVNAGVRAHAVVIEETRAGHHLNAERRISD